MSSKKGKIVAKETIIFSNYTSPKAFNEAVRAKVEEYKSNKSLYRDNKVGKIRVFRNGRGATVIAHDLP